MTFFVFYIVIVTYVVLAVTTTLCPFRAICFELTLMQLHGEITGLVSGIGAVAVGSGFAKSCKGLGLSTFFKS
jgi:hypothetical protein